MVICFFPFFASMLSVAVFLFLLLHLAVGNKLHIILNETTLLITLISEVPKRQVL